MALAPHKTCSKCRVEKSLEDFAKNKRKRDGRQAYCKGCQHLHHEGYYPNNKEKFRDANKKAEADARILVLEYLRTHPCIDCGEADLVVLEFDHVSGTKRATISLMVQQGWSLNSIRTEIEKCEVRCANCHRRKTAKQLGFWKILGL